jgi:hypothetical protein
MTHKNLKVAVVSELKETYSLFGSTTPYVVSANLRLVVHICRIVRSSCGI